MLDIIIFIFLNVTCIFVLAILIKTLRYKNKDRLQWTVCIIVLLTFMWCSGMLMQVYIYYFFQRTFMFLVYYYCFGSYFLPSFVLLFAIFYIKPETKINYKFLFTFIVPTLFFGLVLTNQYHHLLYVKYAIDETIVFGKYTGLLGIYIYSNFLFIVGYLIYHTRNNFKLLSKQSVIIIFSAFIPITSNIIISFKLIPLPLYANATSICFSLLILYYGVIKYRFLEINPISQKVLMNSISDAFIVIDKNFNVIGYNKAFERQFDIPKPNKGSNFFSIFDQNEFGNHINQALNDKNKVVLEKRITNQDIDKYFIIDIIPIINDIYAIGTTVLFKDVTELNQKNIQLQQLYNQLKQHADTIEELAIVKERNRVAGEIHDTVGHTITLIMALLETSLININNDIVDEAKTQINDAIVYAKKGMQELRRSIYNLSPGSEMTSLLTTIKSLIADFQKSGLTIDFYADDHPIYNKNIKPLINTLYRVCQEALTNSLKHGKSNNISFVMRTSNDILRLTIIDDGCGCQDIQKGNGLTGMESRIKKLNGSITFGSDGEKGFNINIEIPVKEVEAND